jgi:hypothetical protein
LIQQYQEEIAELKAKLRDRDEGVSSVMMTPGAGDKGKVATGKAKGDMERRLEELKSLILTGREAGERDTGHEVSYRIQQGDIADGTGSTTQPHQARIPQTGL